MNRIEWRALADAKVVDAEALLAAHRWASAYYNAGYIVECGLKACVLARVETTGVIFDDPKFAGQVRTHKLEDLVKLADLERAFGLAKAANPALLGFWTVVSAWTEESRYENNRQMEAEELYEAITNNPNGVYGWVQLHW